MIQCLHKTYIKNNYGQEECEFCGLLRTTIEATHPVSEQKECDCRNWMSQRAYDEKHCSPQPLQDCKYVCKGNGLSPMYGCPIHNLQDKEGEIAEISLEFVEMVIKISGSKSKTKSFWVSKTSEKIQKLLAKEKQRTAESLFYKILEEYQPFDEKERALFRSYMSNLKRYLKNK